MKKVGIIGRVNVGKSSLFNVLTGEKKAIVSGIAGTTRDFLTGYIVEKNKNIAEIIDFGGIDFEKHTIVEEQVQKQVREMVYECDLILFVVDIKSSLTHEDMRIRDLIRKTKKKIVLVINKVDNDNLLDGIYEFQKLGIETSITISVVQRRNIDDLRKIIYVEASGEKEDILPVDLLPKVAFVGRPNAGKSSLFNQISKSNRSIVTEVAGTTRDTIDAVVDVEGKKMLVLDTAGLRRRTRVVEELESYATQKTMGGIRRADIICYVMDATEEVVSQDMKLLSYIDSLAKHVIIIVNKWDLRPAGMTTTKFAEYMSVDHSVFAQMPIVFLSAKTGVGMKSLVSTMQEMFVAMDKRIATPKLNNYIGPLIGSLPGFRGKVKYATQVGINPHQFVFFANKKDHFSKKIVEQIKRKIRHDFDLQGIGIEIIINERRD